MDIDLLRFLDRQQYVFAYLQYHNLRTKYYPIYGKKNVLYVNFKLNSNIYYNKIYTQLQDSQCSGGSNCGGFSVGLPPPMMPTIQSLIGLRSFPFTFPFAVIAFTINVSFKSCASIFRLIVVLAGIGS